MSLQNKKNRKFSKKLFYRKTKCLFILFSIIKKYRWNPLEHLKNKVDNERTNFLSYFWVKTDEN